jgi:hypothetical protein
VTAANADYVGELYDGVLCPDGTQASCNLASGTSVPAAVGNTTTGIDFALAHKGTIKGTVRDAATMQPLVWAEVVVYNSAGAPVAWTSTDSNGNYVVPALAAGNYFVVADSDSYPYFDAEVFDGLPCPGAACNPTSGTPVPVALNTTTSGIDFELSRSHAITGVVLGPGGAPATNAGVDLYDSNGFFHGSASVDSQGHYELRTEPGTWYLVASGYELAPQLYSGIPCPSNCDVSSGTPVVLTVGNDTTGIDFALSWARGIVGRVTDAGHPLPGVAIDLWDAAGEHVASAVTGPTGIYRLLPNAGTYFVSTDSGMGALEEVWNNVPCPSGPAYQGLCDPTTGTSVTVAGYDSLVSGIDFALDRVQLFVNSFEPGGHGWSAKWPP